ncbi:MAG: HAMP domain-containing sensor histidine kinase [Bacteroidia bacterium]|nr:HAMP domain-containing sensor histidine kinase [Bacteroidia bacterium]
MGKRFTISELFACRLGLFAVGIGMIVFGFIRELSSVSLNDPLALRIFLIVTSLSLAGLSFQVKKIKENLGILTLGMVFVITSWEMLLAFLNGFQANYWIISLVILSMGGSFYKHSRGFIVLSTALISLFVTFHWLIFPKVEIPWIYPVMLAIILVIQGILMIFLSGMDRKIAFLAGIPESNPMPVIEVDAKGDVTYINPSGREEFPYLFSHAATHPLLNQLKDNFRTLKEAGQVKGVDINLGDKVYQAHFYYVAESGSYRCYITKIALIEELLQQETSRRMADLKKVEAELKERNHQMDLFLYKATHDLKGPLTSVVGILNIAIQDCLQPEVRQYIEMALASTARLDNALLDLIHVTRLSKEQIRPERIDCNALLNEILQSINHMPERRNVEFRTDVPMSLFVRSDRNSLLSILQNLITNAIKYRRDGTHIHIVSITIFPEKSGVKIIVTDNGEGIRAEIREKIFSMFYRGNKKSKGTGLGLYIVKQSISKLGGKIDFESVNGEGTRFSVWLPNLSEETAAAD